MTRPFLQYRQCDQIGRLLKFLGDRFFYKVAQISGVTFGGILKLLWLLFGPLSENLGYFLLQSLVTLNTAIISYYSQLFKWGIPGLFFFSYRLFNPDFMQLVVIKLFWWLDSNQRISGVRSDCSTNRAPSITVAGLHVGELFDVGWSECPRLLVTPSKSQ